ncbi:MAG: response regulator transcription factor [Verrucomicrobiia bacterium]
MTKTSHGKSSPIRVYIVDDHAMVRTGLASLLEDHPDIKLCGNAASGEQALAQIPKIAPDVVLLDLRMPGIDGFRVCDQLQTLRPQPAVIVLTSFGDDENLERAVFSGAKGFILKSVDAEFLADAIRRVHVGESVLDPSMTGHLFSSIKNKPALDSTSSRSGPLVGIEGLAAQEKRVVAGVAEGKTNKEIAAELNLSPKTVKNYLSNAMNKLGVDRRAQVAVMYERYITSAKT